jgi:hypothetical protein
VASGNTVLISHFADPSETLGNQFGPFFFVNLGGPVLVLNALIFL